MVADLLAPSPMGGQDCVAFRVELHQPKADKSSLMLRDAFALAFEVRGHDGTRMMIQSGPVELHGDAHKLKRRATVECYLADLDPVGAGSGEENPSPFPWREATELVLRPGDRVAVRCAADQGLDPRAAPSGYRDMPRTLLLARGVPLLELLPPET